jgi:hypothetical protein
VGEDTEDHEGGGTQRVRRAVVPFSRESAPVNFHLIRFNFLWPRAVGNCNILTCNSKKSGKIPTIVEGRFAPVPSASRPEEIFLVKQIALVHNNS